MNGPYDDIIDLPHYVSVKHPHMPMIDRAAQFSPFAALTGYDAAIKETARLTGERLDLDDCEKAALNNKLQLLLNRIAERPYVSITYFQPDKRKAGGEYVITSGSIKRINRYERTLLMDNGVKIVIEDIIDIQGELFGE
jgi:hypothetical protein